MSEDKRGEYSPAFECTPEQYHASIDKLWEALEVKGVQQEDCFTMAANEIIRLRNQCGKPTLEWTTSSPTEAGWYVYQLVGQWPMHTGQVRPGNWRLAQDPSRMYCGDIVVDSMEAYWFGPIHEPKKP